MVPARLFPTPLARMPRLCAAVLLGLQVLLWGGGAIIEGKAAAESLGQRAHVEEQGSTNCPPIHSHLDCQICRTLTGGATCASAPAMLVIGESASDQPSSRAETRPDRWHTGNLGSRAPPDAARHALAA